MSHATAPTDRTLSKWLALAGFLVVLALVAVVLRTPPAAGYEPSIYAGYPLYFWVLVVVAMCLGQFVLLRAGLREDSSRADWGYGLLLTLVVGALLLFMPYIRGYPLYGRGDVLSHLGYIETIQATGGAPFQNNYQNIHQLVLALSYATGLEPIQVINAVAGIISLLSIGAAYVLLVAVFDRQRALLTLPFVVTLVAGRAHLNPSPYAQSLLLLPFVLYLFVRTQQTESIQFRLALAATIVAVVIYHPLTALFLIVVFCLHYGVVIATKQTQDQTVPPQLSSISSKSVTQLSVVVFVGWYYNFTGIILRFETVTRRLLGTESGQSDLATYTSTVQEYSPSLVDIFGLATLWYGQKFLLLSLGGLFVVLMVVRYLRGGRVATPYLLTFGLGMGLFSGLGVVFLVVDLIGGFGRPLGFAVYFAVFMAGALVYSASESVNTHAVAVTVAVVLVALTTISVFGLYHSAMAGESNQQVTAQDLDGAAWYMNSTLQDEPLQEQGVSMYRFEHALEGLQNSTVQRQGTQPPPRLNYTTHPRLGDSYNMTQTYVLTESARQFYPTVYPDYEDSWQYRPADYDRLARDPTVSRLYDNGEFEIYVIEPTGDD